MQRSTGVNRSKWDLSLATGHKAEALVWERLTGVAAGTVEVKRDAVARQTGNLYVEFQQLGPDGWKPSGIATTEADAWAFVIPPSDAVLVVPTVRLKEIAREAFRAGKKRSSDAPGDIKTCGVLVRVTDILNGAA